MILIQVDANLNDDTEADDFIGMQDGLELYSYKSAFVGVTDSLTMAFNSSDYTGLHPTLLNLLRQPVRITIETIEEVT